MGESFCGRYNVIDDPLIASVQRSSLRGCGAAGIISAMMPQSFFETLFIGSGGENVANPGFLAMLAQTLIGPLATFFTFVGSMGNIPLAAVLFAYSWP